MNKLQALQSKLSDARTAIAAALAQGNDTENLRQIATDLESELAAAEKAAATEQADQLAAERAKAAENATVAVSEAHSAVTAAAGTDVVAGVQMPVPEVDPVIADAASRLSAARDRLAREEGAYKEHADRLSNLQKRLSDKEAARDEILQRRTAGDEKSGDAGEIALLAEDISNLKELVAQSRNTAEQHRPGTAKRLVADAEKNLAQAQGRAVFNAKLERAKALELAFLQAHSELVSAGAAIGERNRFSIYRPSEEFRRVVYGTV